MICKSCRLSTAKGASLAVCARSWLCDSCLAFVATAVMPVRYGTVLKAAWVSMARETPPAVTAPKVEDQVRETKASDG